MSKVICKSIESLSQKEIKYITEARVREYGEEQRIDFKKEDKNSHFFLVKENNKIVAFGMVKPIEVELEGKKYEILGMGRGLAIEKGKGYGKKLGISRLNYAKKQGKTIIAFTSPKNIGFFEKCGFKIDHNLIKRFAYKKSNGTIVYDPDGEGVYYQGKDKFVSKVNRSKEYAYIRVPFW